MSNAQRKCAAPRDAKRKVSARCGLERGPTIVGVGSSRAAVAPPAAIVHVRAANGASDEANLVVLRALTHTAEPYRHGATRDRGAERIRTAVKGFAGLCLTSRPRRREAEW